MKDEKLMVILLYSDSINHILKILGFALVGIPISLAVFSSVDLYAWMKIKHKIILWFFQVNKMEKEKDKGSPGCVYS